MLLHKKEFFGNGFFTADHVTVCGLLVLFLCYFGLYIRTHVETVCLLSKLHEAKHHINVKVDMDELDLTSAEAKATYKEIEEWVQEHYGFHVTNLNIAQVKQKHGIIERENYNKPKSEDSRQPGTTPEKEKAITEAFKYFKMI
ncbi:23S rRNA (uracil1939-C5)-methyltransferase [Butyrivibrio sp. YAB3001]|nr:23S rRNA (uracil1939-C5)-methyltransferase [Butyrivibrio sp. YAB3001]